MREPDWPLREGGSSFIHHVVALAGTVAPLLALVLAALALIPVWRVWGRHRLAASGRWVELRLGEQVSRPALETLMSTLAGGLPRPLLGPTPWVALSLTAQEDRAECGLFISGGVSVAQVRAAVEQGLGGVSVETVAGNGPLDDVGEDARLRVASLTPLASRFLPLRVDHRVDPAGQLLAALRAQEAARAA